MNKLEKILDYQFKDPAILDNALRHRSVPGESNERLEFIGDAILSFIISTELYREHPRFMEGTLSRLRANLVKGDTLAELATEFHLGEFIHLGPGEKKSGGYRRASILADGLEAIIGAIYLDGGIEICQTKVLQWYAPRLADLTTVRQKDSKSLLQEFIQAHKQSLPSYEIVAVTGKAHEQVFCISCRVDGYDFVTEGSGQSRQQAEQEAAAAFLARVLPNE